MREIITRIKIQQSVMPRNNYLRCHAFITADPLCRHVRVDPYTMTDDTGYQRMLNQQRVTGIGKQLINAEIDLPTGLLLNLRDFDPERHLLGDHLVLTEDDVLYAVDGQHRVKGLQYALDKDPYNFQGYELSVDIGLGWSKEYEREQFHVINTESKPMDPSLKQTNLARIAVENLEKMSQLKSRNDDWRVRAQDIVEHMGEEGKVWHRQIQFANHHKGATTVTLKAMVESWKPLLLDTTFRQLELTEQSEFVEAYWETIKSIQPNLFVGTRNRLFARQGAGIMNILACDIFRDLEKKDLDILDIGNLDRYLRPVLTTPINLFGLENCTGIDFWNKERLEIFNKSDGRDLIVREFQEIVQQIY